jgi:hypothetical protein
VPQWYWDLMTAAPLCDLYLEIADETGWEGTAMLLPPEAMVEEAFNLYPGMELRVSGLVPIAGCCRGSGDQFFCNLVSEGPVLQVDHQAPVVGGVIPKGGSWIVASTLFEFLSIAKVPRGAAERA